MIPGEEKTEGGILFEAVVCPDCDDVRWVRKVYTRHPVYTGKCRSCAINQQAQRMGIYSHRSPGYDPDGKRA